MAAFFITYKGANCMLLARLILCLTFIIFLTSCAGTYRSYADMIRFAFIPGDGASLTASQIRGASHDYVYITYGKRPQAALGLMFIEQNKFKWVSADNAMLVTANGRISKTVGLENDLLYVSNLDSDPLQKGVNSGDSWERIIDWQNGEYGYQVDSSFEVFSEQYIEFFSNRIKVTKVVETLEYKSSSRFWRFNRTWHNVFWIEPTSGTVLKSVQQLSPIGEPFELTFISEIVRHLNSLGVHVEDDD